MDVSKTTAWLYADLDELIDFDYGTNEDSEKYYEEVRANGKDVDSHV